MDKALHKRIRNKVMERLPDAVAGSVTYRVADRMAREHGDAMMAEMGYGGGDVPGPAAADDRAMAVGPLTFPVKAQHGGVHLPAVNAPPDGSYGADSRHAPARTPKGRRI